MNKTLEKNLMPNEKVIKTARFSFVMFVPSFLMILFMFGALSDEEIRSQGGIATFLFIFVAIILAIPGLIVLLSTVLAVTDRRIYGKTGLIKTNELTSPLRQIQNVQVNRSFFGKLLRYGTITITTTSGTYSFKYVVNPNKFRTTLMSQIEKSEYDKMDIHAEKIADAIYRKNQE